MCKGQISMAAIPAARISLANSATEIAILLPARHLVEEIPSVSPGRHDVPTRSNGCGTGRRGAPWSAIGSDKRRDGPGWPRPTIADDGAIADLGRVGRYPRRTSE